MDLDARLTTVGARIRAARQDREVTQTALAKAIGMQRPDLSKIESGRQNVTLSTLYRIADHLGVPASSLLPE
ncbi:helix-turn-helix domain-containing protein [Mycolicibacterium fortuitum]|uniref:helix-turn-helix domain-containing protein n=1 Tax=Mycolicibacterium fortuitum TaxID=1766 RepID=UPI003AAC9A6A